jgi:hypothetical protein
MDDVFDSGIAAWKSGTKKASRLEQLEREIEEGVVKVVAGAGNQSEKTGADQQEKV